MSGGGDKRGEKKAAKKLVQSLQDIVNRPLPEIMAALRDCSMNPGAAVVRLLSQGKQEIADEEVHYSKSKKEKTEEDNLSLNDEDDEDSASSTHDLDLPKTSDDELKPYNSDLEEKDDGDNSIEGVDVMENEDEGEKSIESRDEIEEQDEDHMIYHAYKKPKVAAPSELNTGKKKHRNRKYKEKPLFCKTCKSREFSNHYELRVHRREEHGGGTA